MKITIDIPNYYASTLGKWASVSRTLKTAMNGLEAGNYENESDKERFMFCIEELETIEPAIEYLHYVAKHAIWEMEKESKRS